MFTERLRRIEMSGIRKMLDMASEDAVNLGLGEPDFQPPPNVKKALAWAANLGFNKYGPTAGTPELREVIAEKVADRTWSGCTGDNVIVTTGATEGTLAALLTTVDPGDEVLLPDPAFVLYAPQIILAGGDPVRYPLREEEQFLPVRDEIEEKITDDTAAILINSPSNPTGQVYDRSHVDDVVDLANEHDLFLLSDEVYDEILYEGEHHSPLPEYEKTILINSFSKTYAMTGWRLGYLVAREEMVDSITTVHYHCIACPPSPIQYAATEAVTGSGDYTEEMAAQFKARRDFILQELETIPGFDCVRPRGAYYAFPSFDPDVEAQELAERMVENGVICTPGSAFGPLGEGHLRFSYANSLDNIKRGMDRVRRVMEELT